jgi:uncharacterized protein YdeI (YjbR/CyaY-like superfamily)
MKLTFTSAIEEINSFKFIRVPLEISKQLPSRSLTMIKGSINNTNIQTVLEPDGKKSHLLELTLDMLNNSKSKVGEEVNLEIEVSKDWIEPTIPDDLVEELKSDKIADTTWSLITPMARWEWIRWIRSTHNAGTRAKRISVAMSKLSKGDRRPCCFNTGSCTIPEVSENSNYGWVLRQI